MFMLLISMCACRTYVTTYDYFYKETTSEYVIDSLSKVHNLNLPVYTEWAKSGFFTDDRRIVYQYSVNGKRNDSLFVISVIDDSVKTVKMRIEVKHLNK